MQTSSFDKRLNITWWTLRMFFGVVPIVAGLDKYFNLLTNWEEYLNPLLVSISPLPPHALMHTVGVIEIAAGLIVLSRWTRPGAYLVAGWLVCIALNLIFMGRFLDVAVRDLGLALSAFSLAQISAIRAGAPDAAISMTPAAARG